MILPRLALRNLGRHRRRSLMLGSAIALGTAVLVTANAFSHGISVTIFERVVVWIAGHAGVVTSEVGSPDRQLFRDGPFLREQFRTIPQIKRSTEAVSTFARALGKGKSDNAFLIGVDLSENMDAQEMRDLEESFHMTKGKWTDLSKDEVDIPLILAAPKAAELGVDSGDEIRLRFSDAHGAYQAAKAKVAGIFRTDNMFMQAPIFVEMGKLRELMGYQPWESSGFTLVLKNPLRDAQAVADSLQARLRPHFASIHAVASSGRYEVWGLRSDSTLRAAWAKRWNVPDSLLLKRDLALVGKGSGLSSTDTLSLSWAPRHGTDSGHVVLRRILPVDGLPDSVVLLREESFYRAWNGTLPPRLDPVAPFDTAWFAKEWKLLPRSANTDEYRKRLSQAAMERDKGPMVVVYTMYEAASDILKLESVLNLITGWAVVTLFLIILIGVINSLRMTIRERTREIGTLRAIGFQARQVMSLFILETLFLAVFSCAAGVALGFLAMWGLSSIPIELENNPMGMLLVNGHLFFSPTVGGIAFSVALISLMATATAILPARSAARLAPADALRHHE